jgi:hypothetical protein
MAELDQDIDFSAAIVGATPKKAPAVVKKKSQQELTSGLNSALAPTKSSLASPSLKKPEEEEIGVIDDLWNSLKGTGAKVLSAFMSIPEYSQTAALDLFMSATGMRSDFSKLPSSDKKQIRDALSGITKAGAMASGTATQILPSVIEVSQRSSDFLNKKSEDIYKKTRQNSVDVLDELQKFKDNPNAESIQKILYQGLKTTVESAPYMVMGAVSLPLLGVTSAAGKRKEELEATGGDLGVGYLLNSGISGAAEMVFEGTTQKILGKAARAAVGNKVAADAVAEGFAKSIVKDFGQEGLSEGATTLIQEVSDKVTKGEDVDWWRVGHDVANSTILGGISGAGISSTGAGIGKTRGYVAKLIMPTENKKKIEDNIDTIQALNVQHGEDVSEDVNKVITQKIKDLTAENERLIKESESVAENLSKEQLEKVFAVDDELYKNYKSADALINDPTMDQDAKDLLLKDLLKKQNNLKQERDAIQKQATSQIPVQPEAGVSGEVAQGEPQAEPQVPTEEVKVEEVTTPQGEIVATEEVAAPAEMSKEEWTKVQDLADRISKGEEITSQEDLKLQETYPQTVEKLIAKKEEAAPKEEFKPEEKTKLSDTQKTAIQEAVKRGEDMVKRYPKQDDLILKYKALQQFQKKNQEYIDADQSQKDEMTRQINFALGLAAKKSAQSAKSILGIKPTMVTVDQMASLKDQLMMQEKAAQGGVDFANKAKKIVNETIKGMEKGALDSKATNSLLTALNAKAETPAQRRDIISKVIAIFKKSAGKIAIDELKLYNDQIKIENKASANANKIRKEVVDKIKSFVTRGALSKAQQKSLLNSLAKTNILNPGMRDRLFERMQKMFERADYQDRIKEATTFRNRIKKLAKSETLQGSVAKMAKDFSKVIPEFTDIDTYLDNAREVYGAIKSPIRKAAVIENIADFSKKELAKQEERLKNTLLDQYSSLVDEGKINESMSLAEIQKYIMDVEAGIASDSIDNEAEIRGNINELFNSMLDITDSILKDGYNPLTNEDVELDAYTKKLIKDFTSMDLDKMSIAEAYRATEALENFIVNDIVDNMEAMYKVYEGAQKAEALEKSGVVAQSFRRVFGGKAMNMLSQSWTSALSPVKSTLDLVHRSRTVGSKVFDAMGLRTLSNEASRAKAESNNIDKAYSNKFDKTKPNGKDFKDIDNVFERGIYAHLRRTFDGTADQVQAEFNRRKSQVSETIDTLLKSEDSSLVKRGKTLDAIFSNFKDANNIAEVEASIDPINKDAVVWWNTVYDKYYPEVKKVAASVYNTILEDDINYSPDNYEIIVEGKTKDVDQPSSYRMGFDFLNQKKSGTLMKNKRLEALPKDRVISFDFDYNNSSAFGKMLTDVRTAPSVQQYKGFVNSPAFEKIYPNTRDRNTIEEKLNWYVNEVRSKNAATGSVNEKAFAKIVQSISRYGTSRALGSLTSGIKQFGTAMVNTSIALANDPASTKQGIKLLFNKDAQNFLENSGYGIANRGLESQTAIESANKIIEQTDVNSIDKVTKAIGKAGKIYLESSLKNGDVLAARASWYAYYVHKLKKLGYNTDNIDWKNHELVKEAADYAEDQVNLQQNVSDSAMMGKFLTTKNPYVTIARSMVVPFSSFIFNAKDKITTDITILTSKNSNKQDKIDAFKSLAATSAEMIAFEAMSATISSGIIVAANSILGYDESEEEKEKRINQYMKTAATRFTTDVLSPLPNIGDKAVVGAVNAILNMTQQDVPEEERALLFEYKPQSEADALLNLIGGIPQIAVKPLLDMGDTMYKITSDSYEDKYGNVIELSDDDKEKLKYVLAVELLGATNILPTEVVRLNEKVKQKIEKEAR